MSDLPAPPSLPPRARNAAPRAIVLTSHPPPAGQVVPLRWGATDPAQRGPVIATLHTLAAKGQLDKRQVARAIKELGVDPEKAHPEIMGH